MILPLMLQAWGLVAVMMLALWLIQARTKNASYVDLGWTSGLLLCCWFYTNHTGPMTIRKMMILMLVIFWASRLLSLLIARLLHEPKEDSRYARIREDWKTHQNFKFFFMFQFQGFLDVVLSWGFLVICLNPAEHLSILEYVGVTLWVIGFIGESLADYQLSIFKANPANKGKTCQLGLWNYSRHPNYFFEWLMWVAYFMIAFSAPYGLSVIILPILMYYFLMHVSGVPLAEAQALKTREDYRSYQQSTSMFVPLPRKKT